MRLRWQGRAALRGCVAWVCAAKARNLGLPEPLSRPLVLVCVRAQRHGVCVLTSPEKTQCCACSTFAMSTHCVTLLIGSPSNGGSSCLKQVTSVKEPTATHRRCSPSATLPGRVVGAAPQISAAAAEGVSAGTGSGHRYPSRITQLSGWGLGCVAAVRSRRAAPSLTKRAPAQSSQPFMVRARTLDGILEKAAAELVVR
jgi:hypothetical protein